MIQRNIFSHYKTTLNISILILIINHNKYTKYKKYTGIEKYIIISYYRLNNERMNNYIFH